MQTSVLLQLRACIVTLALSVSAQWIAAGPSSPHSADPDEQGISTTAFHEIGNTVKAYGDRDIIVGATLLIIKDRHCILSEACGWQDREQAKPMRSDTLCNIRSMTKMLTGAACQILIDEDMVGLTNRVAEYLPGFDTTRSRGITVEQLLTHRSGLPLTILTSLDQYATLYDMANAVGQRGPQFTPGSRFWYSDAGTDCLGAVVEVASGTTLDVFVRARLLQPLEMRDTFYLQETAIPRDRIATLYMGKVGAWTSAWTPDLPFYPFAWGSQSLFSTPADYAKFLAMLMDKGMANGKRILSEAAVARILTPVSVMAGLGSTVPNPTGFSDSQCYYGQMAVLYKSAEGVQAFGHSGSDGTWAWAWPEEDLMILYFTQSRGQATGVRLETEVDRWILRPQDHPPDETVKRYAPYLGWYRADFESALGAFRDQEFAVVIQNERLGLDVPGQFIFLLRDSTPGGRWYFEMANELSVFFDRDSAGTVTGLTFYEPGHSFRLPRVEKHPAAAPCLSEPVWLGAPPGSAGDAEFRFRLDGTPNCRYLIEYSVDLSRWLPLQTHLLGGSRLEIIDRSVAGAARRSYRVRSAGP